MSDWLKLFDGVAVGDRIRFETDDRPARTGTVTIVRPHSVSVACDDGSSALISRRGWDIRSAEIITERR